MPSIPETLIVFDVETTGLEVEAGDEIVEIGAVPIIDGRIRPDCAFHSLVDPGRAIPPEAVGVHGITEDMIAGRPRLQVVLPEFLRYCGPHPLVAQNATFDMGFVESGCSRFDLAPPPGPVHDTMLMSRQVYPGARKHSLDQICYRLDIEVGGRHRSMDDVLLTARAFLLLREKLDERKVAR